MSKHRTGRGASHFFFLTGEKKEAKKNHRGAPGVSPYPERGQAPLLTFAQGAGDCLES